MNRVTMEEVGQLPDDAKMAGRLLVMAPGDILGGMLSGICLSLATNVLSSVATRAAGLVFVVPSVVLLATAWFCYRFFEVRGQLERRFEEFMASNPPKNKRWEKLVSLCGDRQYGRLMVRELWKSVVTLGLGTLLSVGCYLVSGTAPAATGCSCAYCRIAVAGKTNSVGVEIPGGGKMADAGTGATVVLNPESKQGALASTNEPVMSATNPAPQK
jgi:hypothetical protein